MQQTFRDRSESGAKRKRHWDDIRYSGKGKKPIAKLDDGFIVGDILGNWMVSSCRSERVTQ